MARPEKYTSEFLQNLLVSADPIEEEKTRTRMMHAIKIAKAMEQNDWSKSKFARKIGRQPSEITKWLSGTHNFTSDLLVEIGEVLNTRFFLDVNFDKPTLPSSRNS